MKSKVSVFVTGNVGSGKSTVAAAIVKALSDLGCSVTLKDSNYEISLYDNTYSTLNRHLVKGPELAEKILSNVDVSIQTLMSRK